MKHANAVVFYILILIMQPLPSQSQEASNLHDIVCQFDVPFGIDHTAYFSIDRKMITSPRVVDLTIEANYGTFTLFFVNGV